MNKTISEIFNEAEVRIAPTAISKVGNGKKYKRGKVSAKNGKLADCIIIEDKDNVNDAIIEFLRNYIKVAELQRITEIKLEQYIRNIRKNTKKSENNFQENTFINNCVTNEFILESCFDNKNIEESNFNKINSEEVHKTMKENTNIDESNTILEDNYSKYEKYISLVAPNEELWYSYSELNKKEIFKKLYENKYILGMLLEKIAEK